MSRDKLLFVISFNYISKLYKNKYFMNILGCKEVSASKASFGEVGMWKKCWKTYEHARKCHFFAW